ncbi:hypothetical protein EV714DRAFT_277051 [Schizophyllum commune]
MLAMTRLPRQPSNLHWSVDADGFVKHTYSNNQIAAVLQEMNELDTHRPSGLERRAFADVVTNVGQQGKEGTVQTSPKRQKSRGRRFLDKQDVGSGSALTTASISQIVLPEIVCVRISGECPVSTEFLKIVNHVGRAHGLIVRDPKTKMKVWAAVLVACHARFAPGAHLSFARFIFAWGIEYAQYIKRKIRSERRDQKNWKALPSDEELSKRRALHFAREDWDAWRPYAMKEAARRAEDERRILQFVLQCKADAARRKAEEATKRAAGEERRKAEERLRYLVKMMMRETTKQKAESARGTAREAMARMTERSKGRSVGEALAHEKASPAASHNDQTAVSGGVVKGSEQPKGSAEGPSADGSASMMQRQAASKSPKALAAALRKGTTPAPSIPYQSDRELRVYPTREDLQACWASLFSRLRLSPLVRPRLMLC